MSIVSRSLCLVALLGLGLEARAQTTFPFTLDQPNCNFVWTGTTTFGVAIVGNPTNTFQLLGTQNLDLTFQPGVDPFATGTFSLGGVISTNGSLHGQIFFGVVPLGTFDINNLTLATTSPSFTPGAGGAFTTDITLNALTGEMVFTPTGGAPQTTDISGSSTAPQTVTGSLTRLPTSFHLVLPVNSSFAFPGASFSLVGTITGDYETSKVFCFGDGAGTACPCGNNSTVGQNRGCRHSGGNGARLVASGNASLSNDTLLLTGTGQTSSTQGLYFQGAAVVNGGNGAVFGDGLLCLNNIFRMAVKPATAAGASSFPVGADQPISVAGDIPGAPTVRYYQLWYRDSATFCSAQTYNLTNAVEVLWLP